MNSSKCKRSGRLILLGFGSVNQQVCRILWQKRRKFDKNLRNIPTIVGVSNIDGAIFNTNGFKIDELLSMNGNIVSNDSLMNNKTTFKFADTLTMLNKINKTDYDILVDGSPMNLNINDTNNVGLKCVTNALTNGKSVVLANKSGIVLEWNKFQDILKENDDPIQQLRYSATVCGGLPVINVITRDILPYMSEINWIKGIFNSTSNYIITKLTQVIEERLKNGECDIDRDDKFKNNSNNDEKELIDIFDNALLEAQKRGIAELNADMDTQGWDTGNKLCIIMNTLGFNTNINDININGFSCQNNDEKINLIKEIEKAKKNGKNIKLIASAYPLNKNKNKNVYDKSEWRLNVGLETVNEKSFLGTCDDTDMAIEFDNDLFETFSFKTNETGYVGTSTAIIRDIFDITDKY